MIILIDMDDVIADFDGEFLRRWRERHPEKIYIPADKRKKFYARDEYPKEYVPLIKEIYTEAGFIRSLPEIEGSTEAVKKIAEKANEVFICTTPLMNYKNCVREKYEWIEEHLGYDWTLKMILTRDKTLVGGNIIIDDKPEITGVKEPSWEHVLYDKSYNRHVNGKRRLTWQNWEEILKNDI